MRFPRPIPIVGVLACVASALLGGLAGAGTSTLYHNARIVTNDGRGTVVRALLVRDGRVAALGDVTDLERRPDAAGAQKVDLGGGVAFPGLQDSHVDLAGLAFARSALDLTGTRSFADLIARVEAAAKGAGKPGTWVYGWGWDEQRWDEPELPHHLLLSARVADHPVFLVRRDGRAVLVNQAALELARLSGPVQVDARTLGGRILEDSEGHATGVLLDGAIELVRKVLPPQDPARLQEGLLAVQEELLARGLTAVHDQGTRGETLAALRELRTRGDLRLRVACYLEGNADFDAGRLPALATPAGQDGLAVAGVRFVLDGALDLRGAALLEPYADARDERGALLLGEDELAKRVSGVVAAGLQPVFTAEGDRANRLALDLLERLAVAQGDLRDLRPRLETALLLSTKDWPRVPELSVAASQQPLAAEGRLGRYTTLLGPERLRGLCTWRALAPQLGRRVFGSDAPSEDADPRRAFGVLLQPRLPPGITADDGFALAAPTPDDVLSGYTSGPAWACRQENRRGRLKPGFAADLTVFAADPRQPGEKALAGTGVRLVVIDGAVVWRAR